MSNGNEISSFWKPLSLSLISTLTVFMITTWTMWPRDVATKQDITELKQTIQMQAKEITSLSLDIARLQEIRLQELRGSVTR